MHPFELTRTTNDEERKSLNGYELFQQLPRKDNHYLGGGVKEQITEGETLHLHPFALLDCSSATVASDRLGA